MSLQQAKTIFRVSARVRLSDLRHYTKETSQWLTIILDQLDDILFKCPGDIHRTRVTTYNSKKTSSTTSKHSHMFQSFGLSDFSPTNVFLPRMDSPPSMEPRYLPVVVPTSPQKCGVFVSRFSPETLTKVAFTNLSLGSC